MTQPANFKPTQGADSRPYIVRSYRFKLGERPSLSDLFAQRIARIEARRFTGEPPTGFGSL